LARQLRRGIEPHPAGFDAALSFSERAALHRNRS
jgi:hypothetical protein